MDTVCYPAWGPAGTGKGEIVRAEQGCGALILSLCFQSGAAMPGPWLLLAMALTLTVAGIPGGSAQPEVAQQEAAMAAEHADLDDLLRQAERLLLLREDLQRLRGNQGNPESGEGQVCPSDQRPLEEGCGKPGPEVGVYWVI